MVKAMQTPPEPQTRSQIGNINIVDKEEERESLAPSTRADIRRRNWPKRANSRSRTRCRRQHHQGLDWEPMAADDGIEKSAILLIALGEDYASGSPQAPRTERGARSSAIPWPRWLSWRAVR